MSTTFGIIIIELPEEHIPIAHRWGCGNNQTQMDLINPLIYICSKNTPVIPLDNTSQGIETVGDILNHPNLVYNGKIINHVP